MRSMMPMMVQLSAGPMEYEGEDKWDRSSRQDRDPAGASPGAGALPGCVARWQIPWKKRAAVGKSAVEEIT
jgi:hypothetical protein